MKSKHYLLRAYFDMFKDNGKTVTIQFDNNSYKNTIPSRIVKFENDAHYVEIDTTDKHHIEFDQDCVEGSAIFDDKWDKFIIDINSISAIFDKETGEGMGFPVDSEKQDDVADNSDIALSKIFSDCQIIPTWDAEIQVEKKFIRTAGFGNVLMTYDELVSKLTKNRKSRFAHEVIDGLHEDIDDVMMHIIKKYKTGRTPRGDVHFYIELSDRFDDEKGWEVYKVNMLIETEQTDEYYHAKFRLSLW